jgi:hypothetical protein
MVIVVVLFWRPPPVVLDVEIVICVRCFLGNSVIIDLNASHTSHGVAQVAASHSKIATMGVVNPQLSMSIMRL